MTTGNVKWFDTKKGFGFILGPDGADVFVHYTSIEGSGFRALQEGMLVEYELIQTDKGPQATLVKPLAARVRGGKDKFAP